MAKISTWMAFYVSDYLSDTVDLTLAEHGAYGVLLYHSWIMGPLPNDETRLARLLRCDIKEWRKVAPAVLAFFTVVDGKLIQKRLEAERRKAEELSDKRRDAALQRGSKRNNADTSNDPPDGSNSPPSEEQKTSNSSTNDDAIAAQKQTHAGVARQSQSPSQKVTKEESSLRSERARTARPPDREGRSDGSRSSGTNPGAEVRSLRQQSRRCRLPDDWAPSERGLTFATEHGADPTREVQRFRDHHTAKGSVMADWDAAWRIWCGNVRQFQRSKPEPQDGPFTQMARQMRARQTFDEPELEPRMVLQ